MTEAANELAPIVTRPPHYPTDHSRSTVQHLAAFGLTEDQIAFIVRCSPTEVVQHYSDELKYGLAKINARVQAVVLNNALVNHDTQAAKLWLVNKANWRTGEGPRVTVPVGVGVSVETGSVAITERSVVIERVLTRISTMKRAEGVAINGEAKHVNGKSSGNGVHLPPHTNGNGRAGDPESSFAVNQASSSADERYSEQASKTSNEALGLPITVKRRSNGKH